MEDKKETKKPLTADEILAMSSDEVHEWASRKMAERLAYYERKNAQKGAKPLTAEELLAMDSDQVDEWASRKMAERLAYHEQKNAGEQAKRGKARNG